MMIMGCSLNSSNGFDATPSDRNLNAQLYLIHTSPNLICVAFEMERVEVNPCPLRNQCACGPRVLYHLILCGKSRIVRICPRDVNDFLPENVED